jgi:hypothetical protein
LARKERVSWIGCGKVWDRSYEIMWMCNGRFWSAVFLAHNWGNNPIPTIEEINFIVSEAR